jgi:hypothetical protein
MSADNQPSVARNHELALDQDFFDDTWAAICSCGWESDYRNAEMSAVGDWQQHLLNLPQIDGSGTP